MSNISFATILKGKRESWLLDLFVFLVMLGSRDCCVAPPRDATALSAVCDCGVS